MLTNAFIDRDVETISPPNVCCGTPGGLESRKMLDHEVETGRGGCYLQLTREQFGSRLSLVACAI